MRRRFPVNVRGSGNFALPRVCYDDMDGVLKWIKTSRVAAATVTKDQTHVYEGDYSVKFHTGWNAVEFRGECGGRHAVAIGAVPRNRIEVVFLLEDSVYDIDFVVWSEIVYGGKYKIGAVKYIKRTKVWQFINWAGDWEVCPEGPGEVKLEAWNRVVMDLDYSTGKYVGVSVNAFTLGIDGEGFDNTVGTDFSGGWIYVLVFGGRRVFVPPRKWVYYPVDAWVGLLGVEEIGVK